jgi:hypothetical protein
MLSRREKGFNQTWYGRDVTIEDIIQPTLSMMAERGGVIV